MQYFDATTNPTWYTYFTLKILDKDHPNLRKFGTTIRWSRLCL